MMAKAALFLAACLLILAAALVYRDPRRQLIKRIRESTASVRIAGFVPAPLVGIRLPKKEQGTLIDTLQGIIAYNPALPEARTLPVPVLMLATGGTGALAVMIADHYLGFVLSLLVGICAAVLCLRQLFAWQQARYRRRLFEQLPDALGLVLRGLQSGQPIYEALRSVGRELPSPIRDQFDQVMGEVAIGMAIDGAFLRLYRRTGMAEFAFLSVTLGLQSQTGGSLAETIGNLAEVIRARAAMDARARALAAEPRMSAKLLMALPIVAGAAMSLIRPGYLDIFWYDPAGTNLLLIAIGLMLIGHFLIQWLINNATVD